MIPKIKSFITKTVVIKYHEFHPPTTVAEAKASLLKSSIKTEQNGKDATDSKCQESWK